MRRAHAIVVVVCGFLLCSCGGDSGAGPETRDPALLGSWQYASTNVYDLLEARLRPFLANLDPSGEGVDATVAQVMTQVRASRDWFDPDEILTFEADGVWRDNHGLSGRWHTETGVLLLTGLGGSRYEIAYDYGIDGDLLTLSTDRDEVSAVLSAAPDVDETLVGLLDVLFGPQDRFVYSLARAGD